jgi:hypothetical protein
MLVADRVKNGNVGYVGLDYIFAHPLLFSEKIRCKVVAIDNLTFPFPPSLSPSYKLINVGYVVLGYINLIWRGEKIKISDPDLFRK